jgi:hypothetical protein
MFAGGGGPPPFAPPFQIRASDVFVATYPKCGTTWTQQIVHGLRTRGSMDFEEISLVIPYIETAPLLGIDLDAPHGFEPRAFKTHLAWDPVPKGGRYIYVIRDPADALNSMYHFGNGWMFERDSIDINGFAPFFSAEDTPFGTYWQHVRSWWEQRGREEVMILCFEDMKQNLEAAVRRIAAFMPIAADEELISLVTRQASFEFMRAHESQFDDHPTTLALSRLMGLPEDSKTTKVRSGKVGEAKDLLSLENRAVLDEAWKRYIAEPLGIASYEELRARLSAETNAASGCIEK